MGTVITKIEVGDPNGQNFQELELEVDTGSNYSALPREMLQALGIPVEASVQSRLANGSLEMIEVGETKIRLGGREFTTPRNILGRGRAQPAGRNGPGTCLACRGPGQQRTDSGGEQAILTARHGFRKENNGKQRLTAGPSEARRKAHQRADRRPGPGNLNSRRSPSAHEAHTAAGNARNQANSG